MIRRPFSGILRSVAAVLLATASARAAVRSFDFSTNQPGSLPAGWRSIVAGTEGSARWQVQLEDVPPQLKPLNPAAPNYSRRSVVAQLSRDTTDERFPILLLDDERFADFHAKVRFKIVDGAVEQMAGLAFRVKDEKNFYVARVSALTRNLRLYPVVGGQRRAPVGVDVPIGKGEWHELGVKCTGNKIQLYLDGKEAMPLATDNSHSVGKIGFFTKSDAVAYFTDFQIDYVPLETVAAIITRDALAKNPRLLNLKVYGRTPARPELHVMGAKNPSELGEAGSDVEEKVFTENRPYYRKTITEAIVTSPLHDRNGDVIGVARFFLKPYAGQMEAATINRVLPIVKDMEARIGTAKDMVE